MMLVRRLERTMLRPMDVLARMRLVCIALKLSVKPCVVNLNPVLGIAAVLDAIHGAGNRYQR